MSNLFKGVVKLPQKNYEEIIKNKTTTINGVVINYDANIVYISESLNMTLNTEQTITSLKNFTGGIKKNNIDLATINDVPAVVDSLDNTTSTSALSANQGKVLNDKISNLMSTINGSISSFTFDTLSSIIDAFGITADITNPADSYVVGKNTITYKGETKTLKNGDVFYIVDTNVSDYWFSLDDKTIYKLETQKIDLENYVEKETLEDYLPLTGEKTITGNLDFAAGIGLTGSDINLKYNGKNLAFMSDIPTDHLTSNDLINYVQKTQYASSSSAGLVKTQSSYGINLNVSDGTISIAAATNAEIEAKTNTYKPIVPANLEKAVTSIGDSRYGRISVSDDVLIIE